MISPSLFIPTYLSAASRDFITHLDTTFLNSVRGRLWFSRTPEPMLYLSLHAVYQDWNDDQPLRDFWLRLHGEGDTRTKFGRWVQVNKYGQNLANAQERVSSCFTDTRIDQLID